MERFSWWVMADTIALDVWKSVLTILGVQFVDRQQPIRMRVSFAGNLDSLPMVLKHTLKKIEYNLWTLCLAGAILRRTAYPSPASLNYYIYTANCTGDENALLNCSYSMVNSGNTCSFEAGVICQGKCFNFMMAYRFHRVFNKWCIFVKLNFL